MPRLRRSPRETQIADDLREIYGGMLGVEEIRRELGAKDRRTAEKFVDGLAPINVNGRKKWRVYDVAKRIYEMEGALC